MKQKQINYSDIIELGFDEEVIGDKGYYNQFGYEYVIITKYLTRKIYLEWSKDERVVQMYRINNKREMEIIATMPIKDLDHLKSIIDFYTKK